jgi:membrane protease subunit HflK
MQQIFSSTSKVMIDAKTAATINLPLDQMLSRSVANEAAMGSRSGPVMPAPQAQQNQPAVPNVGTVTVNGSSVQQQHQSQQQQAQQPQAQAAPQNARPQLESVRKIDPRSRETSRERETR